MTDAFRAGDEVADLTLDPAPVGVVTGTDGGTGWPLVAWADTRSLVEVVDPARLLRTRPPGERGEPSDPALMAASPDAVMDGTEPRPQLTEAQLDELEAQASARRTMPVPSYLALAADLRASRAREAALQQRIDKAHTLVDDRFQFHSPRAISDRTAACLDLHGEDDAGHVEDCFTSTLICNGCGTTQCKYAEFISGLRAALTGTEVTEADIRAVLVDTYTREGIETWLTSHNRNLEGGRPRLMLRCGQVVANRVLAEAQRVAGRPAAAHQHAAEPQSGDAS